MRVLFVIVCDWCESICGTTIGIRAQVEFSDLCKGASNRFLITPPCLSRRDETPEVNTVVIRLRTRPHAPLQCRRVRSIPSTRRQELSRALHALRSLWTLSRASQPISRVTRAPACHARLSAVQSAPSQRSSQQRNILGIFPLVKLRF